MRREIRKLLPSKKPTRAGGKELGEAARRGKDNPVHQKLQIVWKPIVWLLTISPVHPTSTVHFS